MDKFKTHQVQLAEAMRQKKLLAEEFAEQSRAAKAARKDCKEDIVAYMQAKGLSAVVLAEHEQGTDVLRLKTQEKTQEKDITGENVMRHIAGFVDMNEQDWRDMVDVYLESHANRKKRKRKK